MKLPESIETDLARLIESGFKLPAGSVQTGGAENWPKTTTNPAPRVSLAVEYQQKADVNSLWARVLLACSLEYVDGYTDRARLLSFAASVATTLEEHAPALPYVITAGVDAAPALDFDTVHPFTSQTVLLRIYDNQPNQEG